MDKQLDIILDLGKKDQKMIFEDKKKSELKMESTQFSFFDDSINVFGHSINGKNMPMAYTKIVKVNVVLERFY